MTRTALIDWDRLDRDGFDRVVEALLYRIHREETGTSVAAYDGRGGDKGRDVVVTRDDAYEVIYQLKHFPEGFSGGWGKSRKAQIRKSFTAAMEHDPARWVLVIPRNPTPAEERWVRSLKGKRQVEVEVLGRAGLDSELAGRPDLLDAFTRDPLVATLRELALEERGLIRDEHLNAALTDLHRKVDGRSAYWGMDVTVGRHGTVKRLYAKDPRAQELEPITINLTTAMDQLDVGTRDRVQAFFEYGSHGGGKVVIPAEAVAEFEVVGPEWITSDASAGGQVEFHAVPLEPSEKHRVELRLLDADGNAGASLRGSSTAKGIGSRGFSLHLAFAGGLQLEFRFPKDLRSAGEIKIKHDLVDQDAVAVNRAIKFQDALAAAPAFELWVEGRKLAKMGTGGHNRAELPDDTKLLAEDLATIAAVLDVPLVVPDALSAVDRAEIRTLRLLLDGHCVLIPELGGLHATLNGSSGGAIEQFVAGESTAIQLEGGLQYAMQGHHLAIRDANVFHPAVRAVNGDEALAELAAGTGAGFVLRIEPVDGSPFRAYIPSKVRDADAPLIPTPLDVPGLMEHPAIVRLHSRAAAASEGTTAD